MGKGLVSSGKTGERKEAFEQLHVDLSLATVQRQDWEWKKRKDWRQAETGAS